MERNRGDLHESLEKHGGRKKKQKRISSAYGNFFEGYTEFNVLGKNGKEHIERVYTAPYYRQALQKKQRLAVRCGYLAALLLAAVCLISAGVQNLASNRAVYVTLPQAGCIFCLGWMVIALMEYIPMHERLTIYEYKSSSRAFKRASLGLSISAGCLSLGSLLYLLLHLADCTLPDITGLLRYLLATAAAIAVCVTEHHIPYVTEANANAGLEGFHVSPDPKEMLPEEDGETGALPGRENSGSVKNGA
ncbi:MAG: hypothetical protein ACI3VN_05540 [Candidatus Onthomonas sp.]